MVMSTLGGQGMLSLDPDALAGLMDTMRPCFADEPSRLADGLRFLFDELRGLSGDPSVLALPYEHFAEAEIARLGELVDNLRDAFSVLDRSGWLANPWSVAALRRNELRNASVLRWFLDPKEGHGCGVALLTYILERVEANLPGQFPTAPSDRCRLAVEECPDGDRSSRVDIQVDDPGFFLVVEVKVDAPEQDKQVERYGDIAKARATGNRPWAVVFLTTDGKEPKTAGQHRDHAVPVSWRDIALALRRAARDARPIPRFLATSFASHLANL